jgi:hypothetical protein
MTRDDLAAGYADVHGDRAAQLGRQLRHRVTNRERGAHRALDIVAMSNRGTEDGHDAVSNVLIHPTTVRLDEVIHAAKKAFQQSVNLLQVDFPPKRGEANQIGEHHR